MTKSVAAVIAFLLSLGLSPIFAASLEWEAGAAPKPKEGDFDSLQINNRKAEVFEHGVRPEWGYAKPQRDTFIVVHPKEERKNAPLYVVLHSAGHDVFAALKCTKSVGNHDIYRSPDDFYALYLDCRANQGDWWWGIKPQGGSGSVKGSSSADPTPAEKRVLDSVRWVIAKYELDPERIYLCGNSMGGSGALGIGMRHGDVFASIKANVPAGIEHVSQRMGFPPETIPDDLQFADPPVAIDYSAQNDNWSKGHDRFVKAMNDRKYALYFYWGPFGHANNSAAIEKVNDLINSFEWLSIKKNEAYPAFTNATGNGTVPWPDDLKSTTAGQINAFFRWKNISDTKGRMEMSLFLATPELLKTKFEIPGEAQADVSLRRIQNTPFKSGDPFKWTFGAARGEGKAGDNGLITVPGLTIRSTPTILTVTAL